MLKLPWSRPMTMVRRETATERAVLSIQPPGRRRGSIRPQMAQPVLARVSRRYAGAASLWMEFSKHVPTRRDPPLLREGHHGLVHSKPERQCPAYVPSCRLPSGEPPSAGYTASFTSN